MRNTILTSVAVIFLSACTTVDDFHAMSPDERADKVCRSADTYSQRERSLRSLGTQISAKEDLLATGYRVHESCQMVSTTVPGKTVDCGGATGVSLQVCQMGNTPAMTQNRQVCTETPVPIDYNYESGALRNLHMARAELDEYHEQQTYVCVAKARSLPADRAYSLYKRDAEA